MEGKKKQDSELFCMDPHLRTLYRTMQLDLGFDIELPTSSMDLRCQTDFGNYPVTVDGVHRFKRVYQLNTMFKRYIFKGEGDELEDKAVETFAQLQARIATPLTLKATTRKVVSMARSLAREILGSYDRNRHIALMKFSSNAVVGSGRNSGYPDLRFKPTITGHVEHMQWFRDHVWPEDNLLRGLLYPGQPASVADLLTVPKAFDKERTICPDTGLGSAYSAGLGSYIRQKLREAGINLNRLPEKHKALAKKFSRSLQGVTLDVKAGSDCFGIDVVNMLVPRQWFNVLRRGRIRAVRNDKTGRTIALSSFMAMGIGFTFPLESLLFYVVIEAIRRILRVKGVVSVYGDDCIYPIEIHKYVVSVFTDLRILPNLDKTFVLQPFRESCGGDFCHGIDVRPFMYEGNGNEEYSAIQIIAELYKVLNGLLERWEEVEIPLSIQFLERTILYYNTMVKHVPDKLYWVPADAPAYAGRRFNHGDVPSGLYQAPIFNAELMKYEYPCLCVVKTTRKVGSDERVWLWLALQSSGETEIDPYDRTPYAFIPVRFKTEKGKVVVVQRVIPQSQRLQIYFVSKSKNGRKRLKLVHRSPRRPYGEEDCVHARCVARTRTNGYGQGLL